MTGTEKQIKLAKDIITNARETIRCNIEKATEIGRIADVEIWNEISRQMEMAIVKCMDQENSAAVIIRNRNVLSGENLCFTFYRVYMSKNRQEQPD